MKKETILDDIIKEFRTMSKDLTDYRTGNNKQYEIADVAMSGFSIFFMQSASFLDWQRRMENESEISNVKGLFGIEKIPGDTQIRNILDHVKPEEIYPMMTYLHKKLIEKEITQKFTGYNGNLLIAFDATQYFSSENVSCKNCSMKVVNGVKKYFHSAFVPVLVQSGPKKNNVIVLPPEFITPQDGKEKQDCENAAAKRWLAKHGSNYRGKGTVLGDALYACEPLCRCIQKEGLNFILRCKPGSTPKLFSYELPIADKHGDIKKIQERVWNPTKNRGENYIYKYTNGVRLITAATNKDSFIVNYCSLTITDERDGKEISHFDFITDFEITESNVKQIVQDGRSRWSVENGGYNILKNHGYHGEHNFGHGDLYLSSTLFTLNLLAFLLHITLEYIDPAYKAVLEKFKSRYHLFTHIQELSYAFIIANWQEFFTFIGLPKDQKIPVDEFLKFIKSLA